MSISRKCAECGTWNEESDYCTNCGHLLNVDKLRTQEEEKKKLALSGKHVDAIEAFLKKLGSSKNPFKKLAYYLLNALWFMFFAFVSFILFLVALASG